MPGLSRRALEGPEVFDGRQLLRRWIERMHFNQLQTAEYLKISPGLLSQWLNGKRKPGLDVAFDLEARTGIPAKSWTLRALSKPEMAGSGNG